MMELDDRIKEVFAIELCGTLNQIDDRWATRMTSWTPLVNKNKTGRQFFLRWVDELKSVGGTDWRRTAQDKKL